MTVRAHPLEEVAPMVSRGSAPHQALRAPAQVRLDRPLRLAAPLPQDPKSAATTAPRLKVVPPPAPTSFEELERLAKTDPSADPNTADDSVLEDDAPPDSAALDAGPVASHDALRIDNSRYVLLDESAFYKRVAVSCAEELALLARDRDLQPLRQRPSIERRILVDLDALFAIGADAVEAVLEWHADASSPWSTWAVAFVLASIEGREALEALAAFVVALPADDGERARLAAEAVAVSATTEVAPLARALFAESNPGAWACGIELLSLRNLIGPRDLEAWLAKPQAVVRCAAIRALLRHPDVTVMPRAVYAMLTADDAQVAWEAARALTVFGDFIAMEETRARGPLSARLDAVQTLELIVLAGSREDLPLVERLVRTAPVSAALLDALSRYGHPGVWAFFAHYLQDPLLGDDAAKALRTMFGDCMLSDDLDNDAWEAAVAKLGLDSEGRYRFGKVWTAEVAAHEAQADEHCRVYAERRHDELRARAGIIPRWLGGWGVVR